MTLSIALIFKNIVQDCLDKNLFVKNEEEKHPDLLTMQAQSSYQTGVSTQWKSSKPKKAKHEGWGYDRKLTPLGQPIEEVLQYLLAKDMIKLPKQDDPSVTKGKWKDRFCKFHRARGHDTERCFVLKNIVQDYIDKELLVPEEGEEQPAVPTEPFPDHSKNWECQKFSLSSLFCQSLYRGKSAQSLWLLLVKILVNIQFCYQLLLINEMSIFFISLIFNTSFFLLYWGIKFLFFFKNTGQSWHHSWEKWYYLWGSFKNHENFSSNILVQPFFKDQPSCWSSFPKIGFQTIIFKNQPSCWSYFSKNWFRNLIQRSTLVLIIFS